jgi:hypothetical protein
MHDSRWTLMLNVLCLQGTCKFSDMKRMFQDLCPFYTFFSSFQSGEELNFYQIYTIYTAHTHTHTHTHI